MAAAGIGSVVGNLASGIGNIINTKQQRQDVGAYRNSAQDLFNQSSSNYNNTLFPQQQAQQQQLFNSGGYTPGENAGLFQTPDEQTAQYMGAGSGSTGLYQTPGETAAEQMSGNGLNYTADEANSMKIGSPEAAGLTSQALAPISGAATRAQQQLGMGAAARGGYAPGINASSEEVQREQGRQAGDAAANVALGVSAANRAASERIAAQRTGTAETVQAQNANAAANSAAARTGTATGLEAQRANTAANLAATRTGTVANIGQTRIGQQNLGAQLTGQQGAQVLGQQNNALGNYGKGALAMGNMPTATGAAWGVGGQFASGVGGVVNKVLNP